jgi:beta-mannanase
MVEPTGADSPLRGDPPVRTGSARTIRTIRGAAAVVALSGALLISGSPVDQAMADPVGTVGDALYFPAPPAPTPPPLASQCALSAKLVPSCAALFGSTVSTTGSERTALDSVNRQETELNHGLDLLHVYHSGTGDWPTADEVSALADTKYPRYLFANWKPENGSTWAQVAAGAQDSAIDTVASRIKTRLGGRKFFLAVHHEPENELGGAGSGMTPADYQAMFRHVVLRLRADGLSNLVSVWDMMGWYRHGENGLYGSGSNGLYPGDDVVDWIAYDPYATNAEPLATFANNTASGSSFPGFYTWATQTHPGKPLMLAEFAILGNSSQARADSFNQVMHQVRALPAIKAFVYWNSRPNDPNTGGKDFSFDADPQVLAAATNLNSFGNYYFFHLWVPTVSIDACGLSGQTPCEWGGPVDPNR